MALYLAEIRDTLDPELQQAYKRLLSSSELTRYEQFCFDRDKRRFLVTRALVRSVLGSYTGTPPEALVFCTGTYGRPELRSSLNLERPLRFNVSHTDSVAVLAVTYDSAIGVDVASAAQAESLVLTQQQFLSPFESARLRRLSPAQRRKELLALWTLKEAYTKACGLGLILPFTALTFDLSNGFHLSASFGAGIGDHSARWSFYLLKASDDHRLSLCVERSPDPQHHDSQRYDPQPSGPQSFIEASRVVPLVSHDPRPLPIQMGSFR